MLMTSKTSKKTVIRVGIFEILLSRLVTTHLCINRFKRNPEMLTTLSRYIEFYLLPSIF